MLDAIELLDKRQDVRKTEYSRYDSDTNQEITVEVWHDPDDLQAIFQRAMDGQTSPRGLREFAKERALAVRETSVHTFQDLASLYPETVERLESE